MSLLISTTPLLHCGEWFGALFTPSVRFYGLHSRTACRIETPLCCSELVQHLRRFVWVETKLYEAPEDPTVSLLACYPSVLHTHTHTQTYVKSAHPLPVLVEARAHYRSNHILRCKFVFSLSSAHAPSAAHTHTHVWLWWPPSGSLTRPHQGFIIHLNEQLWI